MGTDHIDHILLGVTLQWTSIPSWGSSNIPSCFMLQKPGYALVIGFPEGGGGDPGLMWGNTGTLWGLCNKFLPLWWGKCGDLDF